MNEMELETLLFAGETDGVERKPSLAPPQKDDIYKDICAFANDLPNYRKPGVIFIGVRDDGSCARLAITDQLLLNLASMRSDGNIIPPPQMEVKDLTLRGCRVGVVIVHPTGDPPVRYKGQVWIRIASQRQVASRDEERRLNEKRQSGDLPYDNHPLRGSTFDDLDLALFRESYLPAAVAPEVLSANHRTVEQQLVSVRFADPLHVPTVGGLLTVGKEPSSWIPGAFIQFIRFEGTEITSPILDQKRLAGSLPRVLSDLDELLKINISTSLTIGTNSTDAKKPNYPIVALRQYSFNAIQHRNYESSNAPIRVYWYGDRIEISNPGGLYGQVNPDNFRHGGTDYRNPLLTEAMRNLGYVQRFGVGITLAEKELQLNGNPMPEYEIHESNFAVVIRDTR